MKGLKTKLNFWVLLFFATAIFLRFYNLGNTAMFLGDQGRDAIIVKRILTFEHLPAIGPPSSIGQVYLGPFYYYLITPFLLLFNFNPVGLAAAVGFYSLILSFAIYYFLKEVVKEKVRLGILFFALFSPTLVEFSRFSWNPNLLPYFSFLTTIFFIKALKKESSKNFLIFGSLAGLTLQLHYAFLFILPLYAVFFLGFAFKKKWKLKTICKNSLISSLSFLMFISPLILFDIRHDFLNSKNFLKLLKQTKPTNLSFLHNFIIVSTKSLEFALRIKIFEKLPLIIFSFFLIIIAFNFKKVKNEFFFTLNLLKILTLLFAIAYFNFRPIPHYFGIFFFPFYLFLTYFFSRIAQKNTFFIPLAILFLFWIPQYKRILSTPKTPQILYAKTVSKKILPLIKKEKKFQIIGLPPWESTKHFRYFLEIWGKKPLEEESSITPDALIIVCFKECKDPIANPQWQIAAFPNKKIDKIVHFKNLKIVKIVNDKKK